MAVPPFIGLTGGVASGKSEALAAFERHGAATISADAVVHELLADAELVALVTERWGEEVAPEGRVDRAAIARRVFGDSDELRWLESQLHPRVGARIWEWRTSLPEGAPAAIVEVPLLFETGMDAGFDATVAIVAGEELRRERAARRGVTDEEGRSARQLGEEEKAARATHTIVNDGSLEDLDAAVARLLARIAGDGAAR